MVTLYRSHLLYAVQVSWGQSWRQGWGQLGTLRWGLGHLPSTGGNGGAEPGASPVTRTEPPCVPTPESPPMSPPPQGHMDEDVQRLLCQILRMQRLQEQGR